MSRYVSEQYIEESLRMALYGGIITAVISFIGFFLGKLVSKGLRKGAKLDAASIKTIAKITGEEVEIYSVPSTNPNVFMDGSKIYYTRPGITNVLTKKELTAVLLHEYGHVKEGHDVRKKKVVVVSDIIVIGLMTGIGALLPAAPIVPIVLKALMVAGIASSAKLTSKYHSKPAEFVADSYSKKYGYHREMMSALRKLERLSEEEFRGFFCKGADDEQCRRKFQYMATMNHPSTKDRANALGLR